MKFSDIMALLILVAALALSMYWLWVNLPIKSENFETYMANVSSDLPNTTTQFYPNMRYPESRISYALSENCSEKRTNDFKAALAILEEKTVLSFYNSDDAEIMITCSSLAPKSEEENHFIAGEGGPSQIINASQHAVILSGKISLYRPETCPTPQIATHELLHALGFDHTKNEKSIMFPVTNCEQQIDQSIIDEIERLYAVPSRPDILIEQAAANISGNLLNLEATVANYGFKPSKTFTLEILADGKTKYSTEIEQLEIGSKRHLSITKMKVPYYTERVTIRIISPQQEISQDNNEVTLKLS